MPETIKLHYQALGTYSPEKPTVVLLHGLFGSWENLGQHARQLSDHFHVIGIDARNHGKSPHHPTLDYPSMATDTLNLIEQLKLPAVNLLGHSMGGKTAMHLAQIAPEKINKLCIVDIAPRVYSPGHEDIFQAMISLDLAQIVDRKDADQKLSLKIPQSGIRSFVLKNLIRDENKQWEWRLNLSALYDQYSNILDWPKTNTSFNKPTLIIRGGNSDYVQATDQEAFMRYFTQIKAKTIAGTGHWPHAEKTSVFQKIIRDFFI